ncbi:hypothetical protein OGAPHI_006199 [Ogataea philodendri]|uniref:Uncharacterized protein n=1 Tax=Ogataea philodendri TaxID=1378263 RepID=A0A9P8NXD8_9ASCO|nr:uncharacterized protein OGAPHI_006199 [Ogataea philodendri]KAH3662018.1 hypothetical protein OGAPHI_006199 [Ogataea philodendri]
MVSTSTNDSHLNSVARIPASKGIDDVDFFSGSEVVDGSALGNLPSLFVHLLVDRSPPDVLCGRLLVNDSLVLWRPSCFGARISDQGTRRGNRGAFLLQSVLVQDWERGVVTDGGLWVQTQSACNGVSSALWLEWDAIFLSKRRFVFSVEVNCGRSHG